MEHNRKIKLYNIFAELCNYIVSVKTKDYLVKYGCISQIEKQRIAFDIEEETDLIRGSNGKFTLIRNDDIDENFVRKISNYSAYLKLKGDSNCIMGFLQAMDEALAGVLSSEKRHFQNSDSANVLNTNRDKTGIGLLPRCSCVWARKSRMSYSYRRIDNYLKHFMVMEDRVLNEIKGNHIYLKHGFFKDFDENHQLTVATTPLTSRPHFDIVYGESEGFQVFTLDYNPNTMERDNKLVWTKILEAGKAHSQIIVFPEMLGNHTMESYISAKLKELDESERDNIPSMIILPSFWHERQNIVPILDKYGHKITEQHKQNPYVKEHKHGEFMEDIIGHSEVNIFHYEGIGRFAILICKDFLTTRYMERIMRGYMLTMIIVPSYSTGAYDFKTSFDLCAHDYCNVVWINSCAAMKPGKEMNFKHIGYIRKRISRYDDASESLYEMAPCQSLFQGKCDKSCLYIGSLGEVKDKDSK